MSKRGPTPKDNPQRRNDGASRNVAGGADDAPELPGAANYSARTVAWYETWATSEQASQFSRTDWMRLHMIAPLVELYFVTPSKDLMAEIRQNESKLGATAEDRQRLRWKIDPPKEPGEGEESKPTPSRQKKDPRT